MTAGLSAPEAGGRGSTFGTAGRAIVETASRPSAPLRPHAQSVVERVRSPEEHDYVECESYPSRASSGQRAKSSAVRKDQENIAVNVVLADTPPPRASTPLEPTGRSQRSKISLDNGLRLSGSGCSRMTFQDLLLEVT